MSEQVLPTWAIHSFVGWRQLGKSCGEIAKIWEISPLRVGYMLKQYDKQQKILAAAREFSELSAAAVDKAVAELQAVTAKLNHKRAYQRQWCRNKRLARVAAASVEGAAVAL